MSFYLENIGRLRIFNFLGAVDIVEAGESETSDLLQVMDLGISVDDNGVITPIIRATQNDNPMVEQVTDTSVKPNLQTSSDCPPELALAALECSISMQMKEKYENAYRNGKNLKEKLFETWKHYKQMVNNL